MFKVPDIKPFFAALLTLSVLFALALPACVQEKETLLKVGTNVWVGYEPLYLAREKGFFSDREIRLVELVSASEVMNAMRAHRIDVAALTLDEVLTLASEGIDLTVILVMDISDGADTLVARPEIQRLSDLKGKTIGLEQSAVGAIMLDSVLRRAGLTTRDVRLKNFAADQHFDAYTRHEVDAVITFEPATTRLVNRGGRVIFDSSQIPGRIVDVLVVRSVVADQHPQGLQKLVDAQFEALEYLRRFPDESAGIMAPRTGLNEAQFLASYDGLKLPDRRQNVALFQGKPSQLGQTADELTRILKRASLITDSARSRILLTPVFVEGQAR